MLNYVRPNRDCDRSSRKIDPLHKSWLLLSLTLLWPSMEFTVLGQKQQQQQQQKCHKNSLVVPAGIEHRSHALTIAHRGASYHLPEHSAAAYRLALELGADFIEPDLVASRDGVLFAMHSVDLNVTTDVEKKYGHKHKPWFSPTANRKGYWSFNFTWAQIQKLHLKQRLPTSRTIMYDGVFGIPSLQQILELIHQWNTVDLPATLKFEYNYSNNETDADMTPHPSPLQKYQAGIYVEFKQSVWTKNDSGLDLVELLYNDIAASLAKGAATTDTDKYWKHLLPCFDNVRFDEYIVPGLVLQSFEGDDLERFHTKWLQGRAKIAAAGEPPYILLVDKPTCWQDAFWLSLGDKWRSIVDGIGCEKSCLLSSVDAVTSESGREESQRIAAFIAKAAEFSLVLHPWTERPELQYVAPQFNNSLQEMMHLLCNVTGVRGIFSESVDKAVRAAQLPCNADFPPKLNESGSNTAAKNNAGLCYQSQAEADYYVGLASFVMGSFFTLLTTIGCVQCKRRRWRQVHDHGTRVPTTEEEDLAALELT